MRGILVLLAVLCCVCEGVRFGQLCSGNPSNSRRTSDKHGEGHYNAPRQGGLHKGLDIKCNDGQTVYAPFDVTLHGKSMPYDPTKPDNQKKLPINDGLTLRGEDLCFKLFYIRPIRTYGAWRKGQAIGTMLPMQKVYPGITSHVHVQMCDRSDPTGYF